MNPGSPAGSEYALPLNQARNTGAPTSHGEGSPEAHLFGAGIKPPAGGSSAGSGSGSGARGAGGAPGTGVQGGASAAASATHNGTTLGLPASVLRADGSQSSGGSGSLLVLLGGGVAVLVLGGFGGTVLRHSRRPTTSA